MGIIRRSALDIFTEAAATLSAACERACDAELWGDLGDPEDIVRPARAAFLAAGGTEADADDIDREACDRWMRRPESGTVG